jgi:hypothetical protein
MNPSIIREFKDFLRAHGVWIKKDNSPIVPNMIATINKEKQYK